MSTIKVGPSKIKKLGLSLSSLAWILAALVNLFMHSTFFDVLQLIGIVSFLIFGGTFAYRPPVQISFVVGREELHEVKYVHKEAVTETRIFVDGDAVIKPERFWYEPRKDDFQFKVGVDEAHEVRIQRARSRFGALWSGTTFDISVDGTLLTAEQVELTRGKN
jgi:hypothetical protein